MSAVLKLVEAQTFAEELRLLPEEGTRSCHSIQAAFQYCSPWRPFLARYVIERFSKRGQVVLDPFCATGLTGVEACMAGRNFIGLAQDHSLVRLARARLFPADLAEVALRLQFVPFKRPADIRGYSGAFPLFFDSDTYRELMNLKGSLRSTQDNASEFVMFTVASILHGHTTGHLSVYSSPTEGLTPEAQAALNRKRAQVPAYRAVSARILKKAAMLLRDGIPSALSERDESTRQVFYAQPHAAEGVQTGSVDLALMAPNQPGFYEHGMHSWLRTWWVGVDVPEAAPAAHSLEGWRGSSNEVLLEAARAVRPGGRLVIRCGRGRIGSRGVDYRKEIEAIASECLQRFWRIEGSIAERYVDDSEPANDRAQGRAAELLVLRRK